MNRFIVFSILSFVALTGKSQTVENVDYTFFEGQILIYYDINNCSEDLKYEVAVKFVDENGNIIIPRNLLGDFGIIDCGKNKKIIWDLFKELEDFDGNYKAVVSIVNVFETKRVSTPRIIEHNFSNLINIKINKGKNKGLKSGNKYFVLDKNKVVGTASISEIQDNYSKGTLALRSNVTYDEIKNRLPSAKLYRKKINALYVSGGYTIQQQLKCAFLGINFERYVLTNKIYAAIDYKRYFYSDIEKKNFFFLQLGCTPFYRNNKNLHLGLTIPLLPREFIARDGHQKYQFGLFLGYQINRFKLKAEYLKTYVPASEYFYLTGYGYPDHTYQFSASVDLF